MASRTPPPPAQGTRVLCTRADCVHYKQDEAAGPRSRTCICMHPDKEHHMDQVPCPLFRLDWRHANGTSLDDW